MAPPRSHHHRFALYVCHWITAILVLGLFPLASDARRWEDVIFASIYAQSHVDIPRIQFAIEENPLNTAADPTAIIPLEEISQPPSDAPSMVPSAYYKEVEEEDAKRELECKNGESAYQVNKYDTWGDGWGGTTINIRHVGPITGDGETSTVTISKDINMEDFRAVRPTATARSSNINARRSSRPSFNNGRRQLEDPEEPVLVGSLKSGDFHAQPVCLSSTACYEVTLQGGKWQEEAKWEILPLAADEGTNAAPQTAIAKGRGFSNCTFFVSEEAAITSQTNCPFTCRPKLEPETEEVEEAEAEDEEERPAEVSEARAEDNSGENSPATIPAQSAKTASPSNAPSDAPSLVPTR